MGVDAQMFFRLKRKLEKQEVRTLAWKLAGAFFREGLWWRDEKQACIWEIAQYGQDGPTLEPEVGEHFYEVGLLTRFYGVGYERGPIVEHCAMAVFIEHHLPDAEVWYGGDSSGECARRFDEVARVEILKHFYAHGHLPYVAYFSQRNSNILKCPRCKEPMLTNGGGGNQTFWFCYGCPNKAITGSGGRLLKLWSDGKEVFDVAAALRLDVNNT